eukprot:2748355-Rhodomonas_salina.2
MADVLLSTGHDSERSASSKFSFPIFVHLKPRTGTAHTPHRVRTRMTGSTKTSGCTCLNG